jgi:hypothetical protein
MRVQRDDLQVDSDGIANEGSNPSRAAAPFGLPRVPARPSALAALAIVLASLAGQAHEPQPPPGPASYDPEQSLTGEERTLRLNRIESRGSTPSEVRRLIGPPGHTARQILYNRAREQWLYDAPFFVRLEFEYRRGQEPQLLSVQQTASARP